MLKLSRCGRCGDIVGDLKWPGRYGSIHCKRLMPELRLIMIYDSRSRNSSRKRRRGRNSRLCLWKWRWLSLFE